MPSCSEVTRLWASEDLRHISLRRRVAIRVHLLMCAHCRRYVRELRLIGSAARDEWRRLMPDRKRLEALELAIRQRIRAEMQEPREPPVA